MEIRKYYFHFQEEIWKVPHFPSAKIGDVANASIGTDQI